MAFSTAPPRAENNVDAPKTYQAPRVPPQPAPVAEVIGLQAITDALAEIIGFRPDNATICKWLARGVRGHRIAGRRLGRRWACKRSALVEWASASGAIGGEA